MNVCDNEWFGDQPASSVQETRFASAFGPGYPADSVTFYFDVPEPARGPKSRVCYAEDLFRGIYSLPLQFKTVSTLD